MELKKHYFRTGNTLPNGKPELQTGPDGQPIVRCVEVKRFNLERGKHNPHDKVVHASIAEGWARLENRDSQLQWIITTGTANPDDGHGELVFNVLRGPVDRATIKDLPEVPARPHQYLCELAS